MPVSEFSDAKDPGAAFPWLKLLLPHRNDSELLEALSRSSAENEGSIPARGSSNGHAGSQLEAQIVDAGRRLGEQFLRLRAPLRDIVQEGSALPVLELSQPPRLVLGRQGQQVIVLCEGRRERIDLKNGSSDEPLAEFLVPAPKLTLGCMRKRSPVRRVLSYLLTERSLLKSLIIFAVFVEGLSLGVPLTVQILINTISFGMMTQQLIVLSFILWITLSGAATLKLFQQVLVEHLSRRFFARTFMDYVERLPLLDTQSMKNPVHRFFEVASVDKSFFVLGLDLVALVLQLAAATLLLAIYHPVLLGFTLVMVVSAFLIVRVPFSRGLKRSLEESAAKYRLADYLKSNEQDELAQLQLFAHWQEARRAAFRIALGQQAGLFTIQVVLSVALLFLGGALVIQGQLTLGQLVAAELVAGTALLSLGKLGKQIPKIYDLITSFEKLGSFVDLPLYPGTPNNSREILFPTRGAVR